MKIVESESYTKDLKQIKDKETRLEIYKKIEKIIKNPDRPRHLSNVLKGTQRERIKNYRLIYQYGENEEILYLLRFRKRDDVYKQ